MTNNINNNTHMLSCYITEISHTYFCLFQVVQKYQDRMVNVSCGCLEPVAALPLSVAMDAPLWGGPSPSQRWHWHSGNGSAQVLRSKDTCVGNLFRSAPRWLSPTWQRGRAQDLRETGGQLLTSQIASCLCWVFNKNTQKDQINNKSRFCAHAMWNAWYKGFINVTNN